MRFDLPQELLEIRAAVARLCAGYPGEYWQALEPDRYPDEFVAALTESGWLAALIPEEFGGAGLGIAAAAVIVETINANGCNSGACHAQMYTMGTVLRHGSPEQKAAYLTSIQTTAERVGDGYIVRGQKIWTSRALHSDLLLLLARTTPADEVAKRTEG